MAIRTRALIAELHYAARRLCSSPGFSIAAVLSLAIGMGANAVVFTAVSRLFWTPLPINDPSALVTVVTVFPNRGAGELVSYPDYLAFREGARSFSELFASQTFVASVGSGVDTRRVLVTAVSDNYFEALGVHAALGRTVKGETAPAAVISHALWHSRYGADRSAIGRDVIVNRQLLTIVGIAPAEFSGLAIGVGTDVWIPFEESGTALPNGTSELIRRDAPSVSVYGYLDRGASLDSARAEIRALAARIEQPPAGRQGRSADVQPFRSSRGFPNASTAAALLAAMAGLVLLIGCANVACLLLARGWSRRHEVGIRVALGATRWRLISQVFSEALLLSLLAAGLSFPTLLLGPQFLAVAQPPIPIAVSLDFSPDLQFYGFAFALSMLTTLVTGVGPALRNVRPKPDQSVLGYRVLVAFQIGLCLTCIIATGLFARGLAVARSTDIGFDPNGVVVASTDLASARDGTALTGEILANLNAIPGVDSITVAAHIPFWDDFQLGFGSVHREGPSSDDLAGAPRSMKAFVAPEYFRTLRLPLEAGREVFASDVDGSPPVAVISASLAEALWPGENPVGKHLEFRGMELMSLHRSSSNRFSYRVVGVAGDAKHISLGQRNFNFLYVPLAQEPSSKLAVHVHTSQPSTMVRLLPEEIGKLAPDVPIYNARVLATIMDQTLFVEKAAAAFVGVLGAMALLLAVLGVYGVASYLAVRREQEWAIRIALGAEPARILRLVLRDNLWPVVVGLAAGTALSIGVSRFVVALLHGVSPVDAKVYASAGIFLTVVMLWSTLVPAGRASRVELSSTLKHE